MARSATGSSPSRFASLISVLLLLALLATGWLSLELVEPPAALPADAPPEVFSAARAHGWVEEVAREPHPTGSPANFRVRELLVERLEELGLEVEVQRTLARYARRPGVTRFARVENILARRPGSGGEGQAVGLMAHYDSVGSGPGAADDGSGVASILETLRGLRHHPPLQRDLLVILTDAEERGLLGAQAFVDEHPWARELGVVLNFEARGSRGPVLLFETSPGNAWMIEQYRSTARRPSANALAYAAYQRMPNDTDLSVLKEAGVPGLNFAFSDGFFDYHTQQDRPENLSTASLQHEGEQALALVRALGSGDLERAEGGGDAIYFDLLTRVLVVYPVSWVWPVTLLAVVLTVAVVFMVVARRRVGLGEGLRALLGFLLLLGLGFWILGGVSRMMGFPVGRGSADFWAVLAQLRLYFLAFTALTLALAWGWIAGLVRIPVQPEQASRVGRLWARVAVSPAALAMAALVVWALLTVALTAVLPGGAHMLAWPLAASAAVYLALLRRRSAAESPDTALTSAGELAWVALGALPGVVMLVPMSWFLFLNLGVGLPAATLLPVLLLTGLVAPLPAMAGNPARGAGITLLTLAVFGLMGWWMIAEPFDGRHPRPVDAFHWQEGEGEVARWATTEAEGERPPWLRELLGPEVAEIDAGAVSPGWDDPLWGGPAPGLPVAAPRVEVVEQGPVQGPADGEGSEQGYRYRLRISVPGDGVAETAVETLRLTFESPSGFTAARLRTAGRDGLEPRVLEVEVPEDLDELDEGGFRWRWSYYAFPVSDPGSGSGVEISLTLPRGEPLGVHLAAVRPFRPQELADRLASMPDDLMVRPYSFAGSSVTTHRQWLEPESQEEARAPEAVPSGPD